MLSVSSISPIPHVQRLTMSLMPVRSSLLALVLLPTTVACVAKEAPGAAARNDSGFAVRLDSLGQAASALSDSLAAARRAAAPPGPRPQLPPRAPRLSPLADSISRQTVFVARDVQWFTAGARGKRMLVDIGRVDAKVKTPEQIAAVREVAARYAPLRQGDKLRLAGPWGTSDVTVSGFSVWSGRVVATLDAPKVVDSLARKVEPLVAAAVRVDTTSASRDSAVARVDSAAGATVSTGERADTLALAWGVGTCRRDSAILALKDSTYAARVAAVRDSIDVLMRADSAKILPRLRRAVKTQASSVGGCFGPGRALLIVALRAGRDEYTRERAVLLDSTGRVIPVGISDHRFRAHEALHALDADGDGIDDVAARGFGRLVGSVVVLRLDPKARRLDRLTGGFAWESW